MYAWCRCTLIQAQIQLAAGGTLPARQDDVALRGHAIECRINAEDPERDFAPTPGRLETWIPAAGPFTRVDSHCYPGCTISPFYDSLIAKLIVWGPERQTALQRLERALSEFQVDGQGIRTTIPLHRRVLAEPHFRSGDVSTDFLERLLM